MNKLYELRKASNITQAKLAKYLGIANNTYSQYENFQRQIPDDIKIKLANYFDVSIDYLLGNEKPLSAQQSPTTEKSNLTVPDEIAELWSVLDSNEKDIMLNVLRGMTSGRQAQQTYRKDNKG